MPRGLRHWRGSLAPPEAVMQTASEPRVLMEVHHGPKQR